MLPMMKQVNDRRDGGDKQRTYGTVHITLLYENERRRWKGKRRDMDTEQDGGG